MWGQRRDWTHALCFPVVLLAQTLDFFFHLQIGPARFRAPELLFRPDLIGDESSGIHEVLAYAIQKSDMDLRRTLFSTIVLCGGSTLIKGRWLCIFLKVFFWIWELFSPLLWGFYLWCQSAQFTLFLLGFGERLLTEVKKLAPKDVKIKVGWVRSVRPSLILPMSKMIYSSLNRQKTIGVIQTQHVHLDILNVDKSVLLYFVPFFFCHLDFCSPREGLLHMDRVSIHLSRFVLSRICEERCDWTRLSSLQRLHPGVTGHL